jgi:hypothetical protein
MVTRAGVGSLSLVTPETVVRWHRDEEGLKDYLEALASELLEELRSEDKL